jgi:phospholipid transport system substrate-binding protein
MQGGVSVRGHDTMRSVAKYFAAAVVVAGAVAGPAFAADPAQAPISSFDDSLLTVMKQAKPLGFRGRYDQLKPVIEQTLDLPTMTRIAVGPKWATLSEPERQALITGFTRLTVASYAHNFDGWTGQRFTIDPQVVPRGQDKIVQTHLINKDGDTANLSYRMRQTASGAWKVIDIYYNGSISELTTRRSDFSGTLNSGGPKALAEHLNAQADKLAR